VSAETDAINAYLKGNPGRTGAAVAAYTNWVTRSSDANAHQLLVAFDQAQGGKPLAPGYYWIDLLSPEALATFTAWRRAYGVKVTQTTEQQSPYRAWMQFQVPAAGVLWALDQVMGRPTATTKNADVNAAGGAELEPDVLDQVAAKLSVDNLGAAGLTALKVVAVVAVVAGVGALAWPTLSSAYLGHKLKG
jgi:hypothetical protein